MDEPLVRCIERGSPGLVISCKRPTFEVSPGTRHLRRSSVERRGRILSHFAELVMKPEELKAVEKSMVNRSSRSYPNSFRFLKSATNRPSLGSPETDSWMAFFCSWENLKSGRNFSTSLMVSSQSSLSETLGTRA